MGSQPVGAGPMGMYTPEDAGSPDIRTGAQQFTRKTEQGHHFHFLPQTRKVLRKSYLDSTSRLIASSSP